MSDVTIDEISIEIEGSSDKAITSIDNLVLSLDKLTESTSNSLNRLKNLNKTIVDTSKKASKGAKDTESSFDRLLKAVKVFAVGFTVLKKGIADNVVNMADYVSSVNRFNYTFSSTEKHLKDATDFVNKLSEAWVLDEKVVADTMSRYYNMITTMGRTNEESLRMSKNLTMLTQDLASFWGVQNTEVMNRIASAMRGEAEGLAQYGISLNQATLQSTLYANGINKTVATLNSAQKAELVYYQIMKSTAKYHGYHAKTILQPANALEILKTSFTKLGRAIGSIFLPPLMAIIPYIIAITELITKLAYSIANLFGFDLKFNEWTSGTENISAGIGDIGASAEKAGKEIKGMLGDFDELHVIDFGKPTGGTAGFGAGGSLGLDASEFEYSNDLMDYVNEKLEYARATIEKIKDYIIALGIAIAGFAVTKTALDFFNKLWDLKLKGGDILLKGLGVGISLAGIFLAYKGFQKMLDGDITASDVLEVISGTAAMAAGALILTGGSIGLSAVAVTIGLAFSFATANIDWTKLDEDFNTVIETIKQWWQSSTTLEKLQSIGKYILLGILTGFAIAFLGIPGLVLSMLAFMITAVSDAFGIKSESEGSTEMQDSGKAIMQGIFTGISGMFTKVTEIFTNLKDNIIEKIEKLKNRAKEIFVELAIDTALKFIEIKTNINNKVQEIKTNVTNKFNDIKNTIINKIETARNKVRDAIDKIKGFFKFEWSLPDIKTPHIRWETEPANGWMANILSAVGLPTSIPKMKIDWYEDGGFPKAGDLFFANENGKPEWVSTMNGRTAVANRDQISTGIEEASYRGMSKALAESDFGGFIIKTYLDSKEIASRTEKVRKSNANMYG